MIKSLVSALFVGALAYAIFFVKLDDKTFAQHVGDVWREPVVQQKLQLVRHGVHTKVEEKLAQAGVQLGRKTAKQLVKSHQEQYSKDDRAALSELIPTSPIAH